MLDAPLCFDRTGDGCASEPGTSAASSLVRTHRSLCIVKHIAIPCARPTHAFWSVAYLHSIGPKQLHEDSQNGTQPSSLFYLYHRCLTSGEIVFGRIEGRLTSWAQGPSLALLESSESTAFLGISRTLQDLRFLETLRIRRMLDREGSKLYSSLIGQVFGSVLRGRRCSSFARTGYRAGEQVLTSSVIPDWRITGVRLAVNLSQNHGRLCE